MPWPRIILSGILSGVMTMVPVAKRSGRANCRSHRPAICWTHHLGMRRALTAGSRPAQCPAPPPVCAAGRGLRLPLPAGIRWGQAPPPRPAAPNAAHRRPGAAPGGRARSAGFRSGRSAPSAPGSAPALPPPGSARPYPRSACCLWPSKSARPRRAQCRSRSRVICCSAAGRRGTAKSSAIENPSTAWLNRNWSGRWRLVTPR